MTRKCQLCLQLLVGHWLASRPDIEFAVLGLKILSAYCSSYNQAYGPIDDKPVRFRDGIPIDARRVTGKPLMVSFTKQRSLKPLPTSVQHKLCEHHAHQFADAVYQAPKPPKLTQLNTHKKVAAHNNASHFE